MSSATASFEGLKRMLRSPGMIGLVWIANFAVALPLAVAVGGAIHASIKKSDVHQELLEGFDTGWHAEFASDHGGVVGSFSPAHVGVGSWLNNLDNWWDGSLFSEEPTVVAAGLLFALIWLFLVGGVIEALREGAPRARITAVLADGATRFPRLVRLAAITGVFYYLVFRLARWIFSRISDATIDFTVERDVLVYNLAGACLVVLMLATVRLVSDYAKVSVVLERRRSALLAAWRGLRFVVSNPVRVFVVALAYGLMAVALVFVYSKLAPGAAESSPLAIVGALLWSQLFLAVKFSLRVALLGAEVALFERAA